MLRNRVEIDEDERSLNIGIVLDLLADGLWHNLDELTSETNIAKESVLRILNFFRDYGFIEISIGGEAAKMDKDYLKL
jgi:transcription initiation factor IIE alpha subunit